jgi:hypothetical protein
MKPEGINESTRMANAAKETVVPSSNMPSCVRLNSRRIVTPRHEYPEAAQTQKRYRQE